MNELSDRLAVTGADGFLGWHLRCLLKATGHPEPRMAVEKDFQSVEALGEALGPATAVLHLAGMNRGAEADVHETNIRLAQLLTSALDQAGASPTILFANSTHSFNDSAFGRSKREASRILADWAKARGTRYVDVILPHLFGEGGRPFYNSGFATFCHQLATGAEPQIHQDGELELVHAQRAAQVFLDQLPGSGPPETCRVQGAPMRVSEALSRLKCIHATYQAGIIPGLAEPLALEFFNTYRSYLFPERVPTSLLLRTDPRGSLFEAVKSEHGGQAFLSTTHPGVTRGRHFHRHKVERFLVISGQAEIRIRRLLDQKVHVFPVSGEQPCFIDIPTLHTHEITNVGSQDLLTLFWSHEIFDPSNPDTYPEPVILEP
ncbi:MAG: NAD-dependent epimerase/dehydratase family protein [Holophagaceae bacterium]|uniref:NAD-dependent epimerase/dehydratase family protein n=1 Tax=Candidatus Geothrix skivensis TaxID=2954439 RepID=A0A9D7SH25_9BACT|nr:NAD-dependent epimerase/dehydratase family protein [Candidatus Geothrix skivensis]